MPGATPLPKQGDVFFDARGSDRALRLSRHPDAGVVVLSLWNGGVCQGTFRLPTEEASAFAEALLSAAPAPDARPSAPEPRSAAPDARPAVPPIPQTGQHRPPEPRPAQPAASPAFPHTGQYQPSRPAS